MPGVELAVLLGVAVYAALLFQTDRSRWMDVDLRRSRRDVWQVYVAFAALGALVPILIHLVVIAVRSRMGQHVGSCQDATAKPG